MRASAPLATAILLTLGAPAVALADRHDPFEYLDLTNAELVGELGDRTYDVQHAGHFVGDQALVGGLLPAGGLGLRAILRPKLGLRLSFEANVGFGKLIDVDGPFRSYSHVTRGEILTGIGYEVTLGRVVTLHTATIGGVDISELDAAGTRAAALAAQSSEGTDPPGAHLEAIGFRLGQQVGMHLQVARTVALYADGTLDWDGQWRVRAGVALGAPRLPPEVITVRAD